MPAKRRIRFRLLDHRLMGGRELLAARVVGGLAGRIDEAFHRLDQQRKACLTVTRNREVDILIASEVLIIGLHIRVAEP